MHLQPQLALAPFNKWGLDFIGPISPTLNNKEYILVCIDYLTNWVKVRALQFARDGNVEKFIYEEIFTKYGEPREIVKYEGPQFTSKLINKLVKEYEIRHRKSKPYHPQANGQVEVSNREIENILTKKVQIHRKDWVAKFPKVVWAYRTTWKTTTGFTPYDSMLYGKKNYFLLNLNTRH